MRDAGPMVPLELGHWPSWTPLFYDNPRRANSIHTYIHTPEVVHAPSLELQEDLGLSPADRSGGLLSGLLREPLRVVGAILGKFEAFFFSSLVQGLYTNLVPSQIFSWIFIFLGLGSRCALLFLKKLKKIEYTNLRSK